MDGQKNFLTKQIPGFIIILFFLFPLYLVLYKIYIPHTNSFGCFDDCMNINAGYFLQYGRNLYSEIFFNHQPNLAYLSYFVQILTTPQNLYELLLRHIQAVLLWSFLFNILIVYRFRLSGIFFVIIFEFSKYYLFGYKFLAESFIVYPMVYMTGIVLYKYLDKKIQNIENLLGAVFTWFIVFSREPFIPSSLLLFVLLIGVPKEKYKKIAVVVLVFLSIISLTILPMSEYFYSVTSLNFNAIIKNETKEAGLFGIGILNNIFYPIIILLKGQMNDLRILQLGLSSVFITLIIILLRNKKYLISALVILILGVSNIRAVEPGTLFYQAFRMIPWFGMFILTTLILVGNLEIKHKVLKPIFLTSIVLSIFLFLIHPDSFITKPVDRQSELITNYGQTIQVGEIVRILSIPGNTFYINQNDSLILSYWQSKRNSPYKYAVFGYVQPGFEKFKSEREKMMISSPPDFYFGDLNIVSNKVRQNEINDSYQLILKESENTGLFVRKSLINSISEKKWQNAEEFGIIKPN